MTKEQIAKEIYNIEKPNNKEEEFVKKMCNAYSKDVLMLILETARKEDEDVKF